MTAITRSSDTNELVWAHAVRRRHIRREECRAGRSGERRARPSAARPNHGVVDEMTGLDAGGPVSNDGVQKRPRCDAQKREIRRGVIYAPFLGRPDRRRAMSEHARLLRTEFLMPTPCVEAPFLPQPIGAAGPPSSRVP